MLGGKYIIVAILRGDGGERETEKREWKPNAEVLIDGSCDVMGGDFGFGYKEKGIINTLLYSTKI